MSPRIALVMPFLNEARHLPSVLASLETQSIDRARLHLIAVDNGSTDDGPQIVRAFLARTGLSGEVVRAAVRSIPYALNRGIERTRPDDVVVRLDAHTIYGPSYVQTIDAALARLPEDVWCVGAPPTPGRQADFGLSVHAALFTNAMGLGPAPFRTGSGEFEVNHVYLGAWRPGVHARVGAFDERWTANEDAEFSERLRAAGGRIVRVPLEAELILTRGPVAAVSQWHRYGSWRARTVRRHPGTLHPRHLAPPLGLAGALALAISPLRRLLLPLAALYAAAVVRNRPRGEDPRVTLATLFFFPAVQVAYALGLLRGALAPMPGDAPRANVTER